MYVPHSALYYCRWLTYIAIHLASVVAVQGTQTCNTFGNSLQQGSSTPSQYQSATYGLLVSDSTPTSCAGNATAWNICYYSANTDFPSTTQFGVYRLSSGTTYTLVAGSTTTYTVYQTTYGYVCNNVLIAQSQKFAVQPGDILGVCVQTSKMYNGPGRLGIVDSGSSVFQASSSCTSLATSINTATGTVQAGYTIRVNLGIDTCAVNKGGCAQICNSLNSAGNNCSCYAGYQLSSNGITCNDINECSTNNGKCSQICTNTNGSYVCSCNSGYLLFSNNQSCNDINECSTNNGNCSQICTNTNGSYVCSCSPGYLLSGDKMTCNDINECSNNNGNCFQMCTNSNGSYACSCNTGYVISDDNRTCNDINECANINCSQLCINTNGSYLCSCNVQGYQLGADNRTCTIETSLVAISTTAQTTLAASSVPNTNSAVIVSREFTTAIIGITPSSATAITSSTVSIPSSTAAIGPIPSSTAAIGSIPSSTAAIGSIPSSTAAIGSIPSSTAAIGSIPSSTAAIGPLPSSTAVIGPLPSSTAAIVPIPSSASTVTNFTSSTFASPITIIAVVLSLLFGVLFFILLIILVVYCNFQRHKKQVVQLSASVNKEPTFESAIFLTAQPLSLVEVNPTVTQHKPAVGAEDIKSSETEFISVESNDGYEPIGDYISISNNEAYMYESTSDLIPTSPNEAYVTHIKREPVKHP